MDAGALYAERLPRPTELQAGSSQTAYSVLLMTEHMNAKDRPPYPRIGELYRALAGALGTKAGDRIVDRLVREGEYDWSVFPALRERLITEPIRGATDDDFAGLIEQFVQLMHARYLGLVTNVALDSLNRDEALPLLVEHYFTHHGAALLFDIKEKFGGPDLMALLDPEARPFAAIAEWFDHSSGLDFAATAFPESTGSDKSNRDMIARWKSGEQIPNLQSIKLIVNKADKANKASSRLGLPAQQRLPDLRRWMVVARALAWLESKSAVPIRAFMRRHVLLGLPNLDVGRVLSIANFQGSERFASLIKPAKTLYETLKPTTPKVPGDQARAWESLGALRRLIETTDSEGRTAFHIAWLLGRWHTLSGQFEEALRYYKEAAELAHYRAGDQQKQLVEETLVLAAFVGGNKPLLKSLKHRAIVFGLFADPREDEVVEDWEIDQFRQQFHQVFPRKGRFPEAQNQEIGGAPLPFLMINLEDLAGLEPDLLQPDRVKAIHTPDGQKLRKPQLHLFTALGRLDAVRALVKHGASVDQLDANGGTALLCAIQHALNTGNRQTLDLLLDSHHTKATLDRVTKRKRLTLLLEAVCYGDPGVVERLLAMGATADQRGGIEDVTPLYRCLESLGRLSNPKSLNQSARAQRGHILQEHLRRNNVSSGGVFGDEQMLWASPEKTRHRLIFEEVADAMAKKGIDRLSAPNLLRIVDALLKAGANPNAVHEYPTPGRTPLMLAAEIDSTEAFDLMTRHGGNPYQKDATGLDCVKLAIGFSSREVVAYLRKTAIL